jgi:hypothetical protein
MTKCEKVARQYAEKGHTTNDDYRGALAGCREVYGPDA